MKVLVVFTGGTIGSKSDHNILKASEGVAYTLIETYQNNSTDDVDFTTITPLNIQSENLKPQDWTILIQAIEYADYETYDGVIITHGTDTLAYTSSLLALYFHHIQTPMILVSSHLPLEDPHNNGSINFATAMAFIKAKLAVGVFVSYQNPTQSFGSIFYGERLEMSRQLSAHFDSASGRFARYKDANFEIENLLQRAEHQERLQAHFHTKLLYIKPYPGISYDHYDLEDVTCVLHDLYHSGTADFKLLDAFIQKCTAKGIAIFLAPCLKTQNLYESSAYLNQTSAQILYNMTIEATLAKIYLAYGSFNAPDMRMRFLQQALSCEFITSA